MNWMNDELRERRQRTVQRAPQKGGNWSPETVLPIVGIGIISAGVLLRIMAYNNSLSLIANFMLLMSNIVLLVGILFIPVIWFAVLNLKKQSKAGPLSCLLGKRFKNWMIETGLYTINASNSLKVDLPSIRLCNDGFELAAIGGLKEKLLSDDTLGNLNSFLELNNCNRVVSRSYYSKGWVHYVTRRNALADRLKF